MRVITCHSHTFSHQQDYLPTESRWRGSPTELPVSESHQYFMDNKFSLLDQFVRSFRNIVLDPDIQMFG